MNFKNTFLALFLIISGLLMSGCIANPGYLGSHSYTMRFFIDETGKPLDGNVFNNENLLGTTQNGSFDVDVGKLRPGNIALNGTIDDHPFEMYFDFPRESLNYSGINFSVSEKNIKGIMFNASLLDISKIERDIFDRINKERQTASIKPLKWNDKIAPIARNYSKTLSIEGFHHKDIEGNDVGDRLKKNKIFYIIVAENLFMIEGVTDSSNISENVVNGWLESPGHRSPIMDRDELFSDGASGVYCEKKTCYATMIFADLEKNEKIQLQQGYLTFIYIYDPTYPFDFNVPVAVDIRSTESINIYIVSSREQYDNFVHKGNYDALYQGTMVKNYNTKMLATKGQGIIIESTGDRTADINISMRYS
jgi:hypothetical protein